jgi:hypothetical protein
MNGQQIPSITERKLFKPEQSLSNKGQQASMNGQSDTKMGVDSQSLAFKPIVHE